MWCFGDVKSSELAEVAGSKVLEALGQDAARLGAATFAPRGMGAKTERRNRRRRMSAAALLSIPAATDSVVSSSPHGWRKHRRSAESAEHNVHPDPKSDQT